jgi:hypothetical protein
MESDSDEGRAAAGTDGGSAAGPLWRRGNRRPWCRRWAMRLFLSQFERELSDQWHSLP